jgi:hypothetical protein
METTTPQSWVAIYAAIVSTSALLLNLKSWLDSGIKLKVSLIPDGVIMGGDPSRRQRYRHHHGRKSR